MFSIRRYLYLTNTSLQLRLLNQRITMSTTKPFTNQLVNEKSPYLLQHAHNPINWYSWNEQAINEAKNKNKLIFLSVGYSTCHWCHVMERECFENETIAAVMNEHYVNIKVDREERPDIDETYMAFVRLSTGSGGWPMSVFLTPDLYPIFGGTYFPPEDQWGRSGLKTVLLKIAKQWKDNPQEVLQTGEKVINLLRKASTFEVDIVGELTRGNVPEDECSKLCLHQLSRCFDDDFGGFEIAPKFPQPTKLLFLFHFYARTRNDAQGKSALSMALKTLEKMSKGGIHDHVGQGFARYSTDERWHVPHFEKMLYDQAQLAVAYATAFLLTKKPLFAEVLRDILTYVARNLSHEKGGFYGAEDADSFADPKSVEKREGAFYVWKQEEIEKSLLGQALNENKDILLSDVFCHHYNVRKNGNVDPHNDPHGELFEQNVLIVLGSEEETAEKYGISVECMKKELQRAREILFNIRCKRPRPHLDTKIITSWNGLMLSGYAKASQVLKDEEYKSRATKAATFIREHLWQEDTKELLHCCYVDANKKNIVQITQSIHAFLKDYTFLIRGLIDLYECTYEPEWIEWCEQLQDIQDNLFWDASSKAYNLASVSSHSSILTLKDDEDNVEPAGNSVAVQNLLRLSALLEREDYSERAKQILSAFTSRLTRFPASLPEMTCGLMMYHDAITQIFVVENEDRKMADEMLSAVHELFIPNRVLALIETSNEDSILCRRSETVRNIKGRGERAATAHVCRNRTCLPAVNKVNELRSLLSYRS